MEKITKKPLTVVAKESLAQMRATPEDSARHRLAKRVFLDATRLMNKQAVGVK